MKKTLALVLAVVMLVSLLVACSGSSEGGSKLAGSYVCTSMTSAGLTMDPSALGLIITLELKDDGTGSLTYAGDNPEVDNFTWEDNGSSVTLKMDGTTSVAAVSGTTITVTDEDLEMVFTKQ